MIPHNRPTLGARESKAAAQALESNWVAQGPNVAAFEAEVAEYMGVPQGGVVAVSSGSAALFLAMWVLNVTSVTLPTYACAALRNAAGLLAADVTYVDCSPDSPNLDWEAAIASRADGIVAASMFGIPTSIGQSPQLVIDDVAQAFGSTQGGSAIGLRGSVGVCSFSATKVITTAGQGGALVTADRALADAVRDYLQFDARPDSRIRFNFQMTDVQAAVGRVQLTRISEFLERRESIFQSYAGLGLDLMGVDFAEGTIARYRAVIECDHQRAMIESLCRAGISAIVPVERHELLGGVVGYPNALRLADRAVSLPLYPSLSDGDVVFIARTAMEVL